RIFLDGEDVSHEIRTPEVTAVTRYSADNVAVRRRLIELQRTAAAGQDIVTEGRDQGTLVFPDAECKIFLTASAEERARRRQHDLAQRGVELPLDEILSDQFRRDREDESRDFGALRKADDAVEVNTDGLSIEEVVERIEAVVRNMRGRSS
ncbi:MAG: (d)CMP kinase, partial [Planctomycetota bacterium]